MKTNPIKVTSVPGVAKRISTAARGRRNTWVVAAVETGIGGWLVAIPAGPALRLPGSQKIVGYVGYAKWLRVSTKARALTAAHYLNRECKTTSIEKAKLGLEILQIEVLGTWG
jgi:hypothetical protein